MDKSSNFDENSDVGYHHPSPSNTPAFSTMSGESFAYCQTWTSSESETVDESSYASEPSPSRWRAKQDVLSKLGMKLRKHSMDDKLGASEDAAAEFELMKERFSKLLLGEDMSGSGKGVCTAITISNAITNLYATIFGQSLKLEPLKPEKKAMWKREMKVLLSVCDYIQEFAPTAQYLEDGTIVEMMKSRPRSDIYVNLPALQKLDTMLIEILDTFQDTEFWYAENIPGNSSRLRGASFRKIVPRKDEKWWLPVPCVLPGGLSDKSRKHLIEKRDCANQIHKAAMAINSNVLTEIDIPETYIDNLPKLKFYCQVIEDSIKCDPIKQMSWNFSSNFISLLWKPIIAAESCRKRDDIVSIKSGRSSVGDSIYHYMHTADKFSPEQLLDCLKISSEHEALELADRVESSMYTWRRKACLSHSKSSWSKVKDLMEDTDHKDKNYTLAERAESLLLCLKQRYPELSQTSSLPDKPLLHLLEPSPIERSRHVWLHLSTRHLRLVVPLVAFSIDTVLESAMASLSGIAVTHCHPSGPSSVPPSPVASPILSDPEPNRYSMGSQPKPRRGVRTMEELNHGEGCARWRNRTTTRGAWDLKLDVRITRPPCSVSPPSATPSPSTSSSATWI